MTYWMRGNPGSIVFLKVEIHCCRLYRCVQSHLAVSRYRDLMDLFLLRYLGWDVERLQARDSPLRDLQFIPFSPIYAIRISFCGHAVPRDSFFCSPYCFCRSLKFRKLLFASMVQTLDCHCSRQRRTPASQIHRGSRMSFEHRRLATFTKPQTGSPMYHRCFLASFSMIRISRDGMLHRSNDRDGDNRKNIIR